jgi:hypothetical protein
MEHRISSLRLVNEPALISGHIVGTLVGEGGLVDYPGNVHGPLRARSTVEVPHVSPDSEPAHVLLVFEGERSDQPIIVGVLRGPEATPPPHRIEAQVDGERVLVDGKQEIVLRCGKASITLRRNGRVVIRGTHVETQAEGVNRIRGGSVKIN